MPPPSITASQVRSALLLRDEIALLDVRHEAAFATGHPLFAASMAAERIALEAETRLPRKDVPVVVYDAGEGLIPLAADRLTALGYTNVRRLDGGLQAWQAAGFELFQDVNSYAKAFGELVESRRHTPSLPADDVAALIAAGANIAVLDVRRFDEYATMNIPGSVSVPGAELVLRAARVAPDPETTIIVNCAGRTRSIIGTQSLINAGVANKVVALRNGTIGWVIAKHDLEHGADRRGGIGLFEGAKTNAREVAYRAGFGISVRKKRWRSGRRPTARSIASTFARGTIMRPVTSRVFGIIPEGSWSRRSTWPHRCAARASC
jgi:rhodanese-related sulfurtransferase